MTRRGFLARCTAGALGCGSVGLLEACGKTGRKSAATTPANYATTLVFQPYPFGNNESPTAFKIMQEILQGFMQKNKINVTLNAWGTSAQNISELVGGTGPDIVYDHFYQPYLASDLLLDLTPLLQQDGISTSIWSKGQMAFFQRPNGIFAVPATTETMAYFINLSDFDSAGVAYPSADWTYKDLATLASQLTTKSGPNAHYGTNVCIRWEHVQSYEWLFQAFGGSINNADLTQCTLNEAGSIAAGQWLMRSLFWPGVAVTRNSARLGGEWEPDQLLGNHVSMSVLAPEELVGVLEGIGSSTKWMFLPFPSFPKGQFSWSSTDFFGINAQTKNKDAAWELFKYVAVDTGWQSAMIQYDFLAPGLVSLWDQWLATAQQLAPVLKGKGLQYFAEPAQQGYAIPGTFFQYNDTQATQILQSVFTSLATQQLQSVTEAFSTAEKQINSLAAQAAISKSSSSSGSGASTSA